MIKILQFGEGNFLRTFVDVYFNELNKNGYDYGVNIVKPIRAGSLENFARQGNRYHVVLRGVSDGKAKERALEVNSVLSATDPFIDLEKYESLALDKELKIFISNTTEAGICFNEADDKNGFEKVTYPAKLTKLLYSRFMAGLGGVYILPVELIDNNADELKKCVDKYIDLWRLGDEFKCWNDTQNYYCNTLVDRIVSGYPRDERTLEHVLSLIGEEDKLVSVGEPFGLWAVEDKGRVSDYIKPGKFNIEVVLAKDISYYKKRKVRVLNGSHTNLVAMGLLLGKKTVYDCMTDDKVLNFIRNTLKNEIIPFVSEDENATTEFAESVIERFFNPYLNHMLIGISLNSISKWRARVLPSFKDYYARYGKIPTNLTIGFSYLACLYSLIEKNGDKYFAEVSGERMEIKDEKEYLEYFACGKDLKEFMADASVWGEDLTAYSGFIDEVKNNVEKIKNGMVLI